MSALTAESKGIYRVQRLLLATCIVMGIVAILAVVVTSPQYYGTQVGTEAMFAAFARAATSLLQAHFIAGVLACYLLPVSFLAMAWLAMKDAPWLASLVMLLVFISMTPFAAFAAQDALTNDLSHMGNNPLFSAIAVQFNNDGVMSYYNALFIVGTIVGPTLLGIALLRSRAVPIWSALLITASRIVVVLFYALLRNASVPAVYVQLVSWGILLIGSIPAAREMARLHPAEEQTERPRYA